MTEPLTLAQRLRACLVNEHTYDADKEEAADRIEADAFIITRLTEANKALTAKAEAALADWSKAATSGIEDFKRAEAEAKLAKVEAELRKAALATHRQAYCIQQCAAHIGPDTSATVDGLPRAVKHLSAELAEARAILNELPSKALWDESRKALASMRNENGELRCRVEASALSSEKKP